MAGRASVYKRNRYELLERMLNETSLTTKRVSHNHIIDVGDLFMKRSNVDLEGEKKKAVDAALKEAENRHSRELRAALKRLMKDQQEEKEHALERQKRYYEQLAVRVAKQRDQAEQERIRELRKQWEKEKQIALEEQWCECERLKAEAVAEACQALTLRLRAEAALQREMAVADALAKAREQFAVRERESIERTRRDCEEEHSRKMALVKKQHSDEIHQHKRQYTALLQKFKQEVAFRQKVQQDFQDGKLILEEIQADYERFMNYTDGHFNSDYMMHLRNHSLNAARIGLAEPVKVTDIECEV